MRDDYRLQIVPIAIFLINFQARRNILCIVKLENFGHNEVINKGFSQVWQSTEWVEYRSRCATLYMQLFIYITNIGGCGGDTFHFLETLR